MGSAVEVDEAAGVRSVVVLAQRGVPVDVIDESVPDVAADRQPLEAELERVVPCLGQPQGRVAALPVGLREHERQLMVGPMLAGNGRVASPSRDYVLPPVR